MVTITREEELPIVKVVVPAGATQTISFPNQFFGVAVAVKITNVDAANNASYRIDGETQPTITLLPSAFVTIGGTKISLLTITAGAVGVCQVEASLRKLA